MTPRPPQSAQHAQQGFSLIEIMIVVVIIGISISAIGLNLSPQTDKALRHDAQQLAELFSLAQNEVRADGRLIAWHADAKGYRFTRGVWVSTPSSVVPHVTTAGELDHFERDEKLHPRRWHSEAIQIKPSHPIVLTSEWMAEPWQITLSDGSNHVRLRRDATGAYHVHQVPQP